jgi:uncharacterized protein
MGKIKTLDRRKFLKFMGYGSALVMASPFLEACSSAAKVTGAQGLGATGATGLVGSLPPTTKDQLTLLEGLTYNVVASWGDSINGKDSFGFNNDFIAYATAPKTAAAKAYDEFLWVNHESTNPFFVSRNLAPANKTPATDKPASAKPKSVAQYQAEARSVGGSFVRVARGEGQGENANALYSLKKDPRNFRLDGLTQIPFAWPKPIAGGRFAKGTLANCSGGQTPWGAILTCEENYDEFYGEATLDDNGKRQFNDNSRYGWTAIAPEPPERYGWVVEIDPWKKQAKKLVALGRFAHENACVVTAETGKTVVYMGDDRDNEFIYKFVAKEKQSLDEGELFVADTINGVWLSLDWSKQPVLQKNFAGQTEVLIYVRKAARLLGATPQDRPEDLEQDLKSGAILVALTNNKSRENYLGQIAKIEELDGHEGLRFAFKTFLMGGHANGFACPDNMAFDPAGNLWFTCDVAEQFIEKGAYVGFGNNSLFYVPMSGPHAGLPKRIATAPTDAELTGPCFSPDGETLFLSVQHPGSQSTEAGYTSHWPLGGDSTPKPSVIAITGPLLKTLTRRA